MSLDTEYNLVKEFHEAFGHPVADTPTAIPVPIATKRAIWTAEELVEFLHASVAGNLESFNHVMEEFIVGINAAIQKQYQVGEFDPKDILLHQIDALTDIGYFNKGSFVVSGVDPEGPFRIVQEANMGKLWEDGKPRVREHDNKIIKPPQWEENFAPEPRLREELARQQAK